MHGHLPTHPPTPPGSDLDVPGLSELERAGDKVSSDVPASHSEAEISPLQLEF